MFLCYRVPPQVRIRRLIPLIHATRHNTSKAASSISHKNAIPSTRASFPTNFTNEQLLSTLRNPTKPFSTGFHREKGPFAVQLYQELRSRDRGLVADLPTPTYAKVLNDAYKDGQLHTVESVVKDILEVYRGEGSEKVKVVRAFIWNYDLTTVHHTTVEAMLLIFKESAISLSLKDLRTFMHLLNDNQGPNSIDRTYTRLITPHVLDHLSRNRVPDGALSLTYNPPQLVRDIFRMIQKILSHSQKQALEIFQTLVDTGHIPSEIIENFDVSPKHFKTVVISILIKTSLHWNWRRLACHFLTDLVRSEKCADFKIRELINDVLHSLLESQNAEDVKFCSHIIPDIHKRLGPIPDSLIRRFYDSAAGLSLVSEAEAVYSFTRTPNILDKHRYPPPQGTSLPWLMQYLTSSSRKVHLSRDLATEVVDNNLLIPLLYRARFIADVASKGYASAARALWLTYSVGKNKGVVVGDNALLIRMTSLFANRIRRVESLIKEINPTHPNTQLNQHNLQMKLEEMEPFMDQVIEEYRIFHEPLGNAHHQVLTTYARACFVVGKFAKGFDTFKLLLERKEVPDLYDVNVALSALAEQNPRIASQYVDRVATMGVEPDAASFGTIMHFALIHKDMKLVKDMINRVKGLKDVRLSLKTMAILIRASIASGGTSKIGQRESLAVSLDIIRDTKGVETIVSPQIGKFLVTASLRAGDPEFAFTFWQMLLKEGAEWDDNEQRHQRHLIAELITDHRERGILSDSRTTVMLFELQRKGIKR